ncbi:hypothetical protein EVAR_37217_1 [Eumeta japonica]|uniref:Uncharacterized protein n=1 Tax=Eumeta variegata TaxID=151549 RepID=A0A4C1Y6Y1_EUMVA|nr:hypothetical protein EVAR_37217_1 [Eumeta japonica]
MPLPGAQVSSMTLLRRGNPEGFQRLFAPLVLCLLAALDEVVKAFKLTAGAFMLQGVFSPCESDTPRAPRRTATHNGISANTRFSMMYRIIFINSTVRRIHENNAVHQCSFEPRSVVSGSARVRVCGVPRSVSRAAAVKSRASVPATSSGYPAVCTPSPHTVSAPRERSRSFHIPIPIAILVISRVFTRVNGFYINCVSATAC